MRRTLFVLLAALAGCPRPTPPSEDALTHAVHRVERGEADARDEALAGWHAYLLRSDAAAAQKLFDHALSHDKAQPWARYGRSELFRRAVDTRGRVLESLETCVQTPHHPLCAIGARQALDATGESSSLDADLRTAIDQALRADVEGEAAFVLRLARAAIERHAGDLAAARQAYADSGAIGAASLVGPFSRFHALEWDTAFPPESGAPEGAGPAGRVAARPFAAPDGHYALYAEPAFGDIYYWVADVDVEDGGEYEARLTTGMSAKLLLDGQVIGDRRVFAGYPARELVVPVELAKGRHRVAVKLARGGERADVWLSLARADGKAARLTAKPATGPRGAVAASRVLEKSKSFPTAAALQEALAADVGATLAAFVTGRELLDRDAEGAKLFAYDLADAHPTAPFKVMRAEALLVDPTLPGKVAQGRASRDLDDALKLDPGEASALQRLSIRARGDGRLDDAAALLERARKVASPRSYRIALTEAKLAQARGLEALAEDAADEALKVEPGQCEAVNLRYEVARKLDAVAQADALIAEVAKCPGNLSRRLDHLRARGDLAGALALAEQLRAESPVDPGPDQTAATLLSALQRPKEAAARWEALEKEWPAQATFHKRRADALEAAGDAKGARAEREAALALDGTDLQLRRALAAEDGREVLDDLAQDGKAWREKYAASPRPENSMAVYLLDAAAFQLNPDGSTVERTHQLTKINDQLGVQRLAEVHLPPGAEVLTLRTLKKDGRTLEPESSLGDKESVSLPGVEIGDLVEVEYLSTTSRRPATTPGFASPKFYFQVADGQIFHSVIDVRAPAGTGLDSDAHHTPKADVRKEGGVELAHAEANDVPAFVGEPNMPSGDEILPWVQFGTGATTEDVLTSYGDLLLDRARPSLEVKRFAKDKAAGKSGRAAAEALYDAVMTEVKGREAGLNLSASATLAQGRGSRILLYKAALESVGIASRYVLVRPFNADPSPYRFPNPDLFGYTLLEVRLPEGPLLVDPSVRFAPFGRIPPSMAGQPYAVLPEVGEKLTLATLPGEAVADGKVVTLELALAADGTLTGKAEERYDGFEGAYLKAGLERLDEDQRQQAVEQAIGRAFRGAALERFTIDEQERSGEPVVLKYQFKAAGFARVQGGKLVVANGLYPANLSRRFLQLFERRLPLLVAAPERLQVNATLALPPGFSPASAPQPTKLATPFGAIDRQESFAAGTFTLRQQLDVARGRIAPADYAKFAGFVTAADRAEQRELVFSPGQAASAQP